MNPDIGNSHVIAWYLWSALHPIVRTYYRPTYERFDPEDWTRYDGELL